MASCLCRYRRRILFFCSPCILLLPVYIYVSIALCYVMKHGAPGAHVVHSVLPTHFTASGLKHSRDLAPHPAKSFWRSELDGSALWNIIQFMTDRQYNPILRPHLAANASGVSYNTETSRRTGVGCSPNYEINNIMPDYANLPIQIKNFVTAMHCRDYPLLIDPLDVCDPQAKKWAPVLLMAIKTQSANFDNREAIRETWGRSGRIKTRGRRQRLVRRVFLLGKSKDLHIEEKLHLESEKYGDIIQWDFMDTFFNLTLKDVLFWDWFSRRCPHAHFIFKGDDDVFVRTPAVLDYLLAEAANRSFSHGSRQANKMETFVVGDVISSATPIRSNGTKYYIPESFYKGWYPSYPGGGGVIYSGSLAHRLLEVSQKVHLFPIDDVYLGMCLQRLGVYPIHHPAFLTFDFPKDEPKEPCANHTILLVHKRSPAEMFQLWTETSTPSPECRNTMLRVKPRPD
ncbi:N-acetyllactosaminide beta-1,3-N-acetylglucosaminyltransferase 2-like [Sinocyclocheilus rhinocerous]|uniref:Hexosyltransferase n=1 Tax=Sinocyclocheilus rhinocerous TaxID=307959 RepID=A0A673MSZ9_9TELE|nr:PREDICTED: N-acetyllactosaminide beta-1,3-N-acetylglucosaminyltransferase 2-like [Sinocyclocheilus rhinocerous]XP_016381091.1 PREDICTED: N-acetyllactosaminide beta-1,3-N-acetylglucosaminyltransferase 2-like [Sinocyclocheilus rhinocerous]